LSSNRGALSLIEKNLDKVNWSQLSTNPSAIHILEENPDKIDWFYLSENPAAIHLLQHADDYQLCKNPNAMHLLNKDAIDWFYLSFNPGIFEYDYSKMSRPFTEELMQNRFHPRNIEKFEGWNHD
jgi:hypothetical protein